MNTIFIKKGREWTELYGNIVRLRAIGTIEFKWLLLECTKKHQCVVSNNRTATACPCSPFLWFDLSATRYPCGVFDWHQWSLRIETMRLNLRSIRDSSKQYSRCSYSYSEVVLSLTNWISDCSLFSHPFLRLLLLQSLMLMQFLPSFVTNSEEVVLPFVHCCYFNLRKSSKDIDEKKIE